MTRRDYAALLVPPARLPPDVNMHGDIIDKPKRGRPRKFGPKRKPKEFEVHSDIYEADPATDGECGNLLRSIRIRAGITREQFAKAADMSERNVRRIERGPTDVKVKHLALWSRVCGVELRIEVFE